MAELVAYVVPVKRRVWATLLFILVLGYAAWFGVVLYGEQERFGDDPGSWSGLPTSWWAWIGLGLYALVGAYYTALVVRREVPARTYSVQEPLSAEMQAPSFFQPPASESEPPAAAAEGAASESVVPAEPPAASTPPQDGH